jgi:hypothetical protein
MVSLALQASRRRGLSELTKELAYDESACRDFSPIFATMLRKKSMIDVRRIVHLSQKLLKKLRCRCERYEEYSAELQDELYEAV